LAIFDLDGTLLDTIGDLAAACNHMLSLRELDLHTREEYAKMVGNGIANLVRRALPEALRTPEYVEAARLDFLAYYTSHIDHYTHPYEGIREVLHTLQSEGWSLAVASNKFDEGTQKLVRTIFPEVGFKAIYGNKEGFPLKPDAALLQLIMTECDATVDTTVMIGDSGVDIQTAEGAPVYAAADGKVTKVWDDALMGRCVAISHEGETYTFYKNLDKTLAENIKEGQTVTAGQQIGTVGNTAISELADEPHLHLEMTVKGLAVDPRDYFSDEAKQSLQQGGNYEDSADK
jgi:phosphoglycolate phosphatase